MYYNLQETPHMWPLSDNPVFTLHYGFNMFTGADRGHSSQCLCLYQLRRGTFQKHPISDSPRCFTKDKSSLIKNNG